MSEIEELNKPMEISDIIGMLRKDESNKNLGRLDLQVVKFNNAMLNEWEDFVLVPISKKEGTPRKVRAGSVEQLLEIYIDSNDCPKVVEHSERFSKFSEENISKIKEYFLRDVVEIVKGGGPAFLLWKSILTENFIDVCMKKNEIYSEMDINEKFKFYNSNEYISLKENFMFSPKEIEEVSSKIQLLMGSHFRPMDVKSLKDIRNYKFKITRNEKEDAEKVMRYKNKIVEDFQRECEENNVNFNNEKEIYTSLIAYEDYRNKDLQSTILNFIPDNSEENLKFYKRVLCLDPKEMLETYGRGLIQVVYDNFSKYHQKILARNKIEKLYSSTFKDMIKLNKKYTYKFTETSDEEFEYITENVNAIANNTLKMN